MSGKGSNNAIAATEGENLIHFRDGGLISIKICPAMGSGNLTLATQQVMRSSGIPMHRHLLADEVFFVLEGSGTFILDNAGHSFATGATLYIPRNSWHGFENPDHELLLLWVVTPAGLDGFFRETCDIPGKPSKQLSQDQLRLVAQKYATEFQ